MGSKLDLLEPEFASQVKKLLQLCEDDGYIMKPYYTLRSVYDQAKFYRQSRPFSVIKNSSDFLRENGAEFLAQVLIDIGPQSGTWATNALPGFSWHQHGKAVDCYWLLGKYAEWSTTRKIDDKNGYDIYAYHASQLNLVSGHLWNSKDSVHVQKNNKSVTNLIDSGELSYKELDSNMREMFEV